MCLFFLFLNFLEKLDKDRVRIQTMTLNEPLQVRGFFYVNFLEKLGKVSVRIQTMTQEEIQKCIFFLLKFIG
jgi:hypothetical protein